MGARPQARPHLRTRLLPVLVGMLLILQAAFPYRGWLMLLVILGGLWVICYLWVLSIARNLDLVREIRYGWTQVGDRLEERFTLINRSAMPALWVEVQDLSDMPGYDTSRGTGIGGKSRAEWRTDGVCTHRGVYKLGPTRLVTGDPFGLYTASIDIPFSQDLLVMPPIIPLPSIVVAPGGRAGEGKPRPNAPERTVSAAGVRDYVFGDSVRWIHWRATAHYNSLFVRLFESTPASDWWIVLDMQHDAPADPKDAASQENAITLAASMADLGLRSGKSVGFLTHGENLVWLAPAGGNQQRWSILRAMALLRSGDMPLTRLLSHMRPTLGRTTSLIVITCSRTADWLNELLLFRRRGVVPTVLLVETGSDTAIQALANRFSDLAIQCYVIPPELFQLPESEPGHLGEWILKVLPTGRVVPVNQPAVANWRPLA